MKQCKTSKPIFYKTYIFSGCLALLLIGYIVKAFIFLRPSDYNEYKLLLEKNQQRDLRTITTKAEQTRQNIQKDIWYLSKDKRIHIYLKSDSSDVSFLPNRGKMNIIENLHNVMIWVTEPGAYTKHFIAKEGVYMMPSYQFFACDAIVKILPENTLTIDPNQILLTGKAKELFFQIEDHTPHLTAKDFSAELQGDEQ